MDDRILTTNFKFDLTQEEAITLCQSILEEIKNNEIRKNKQE